MGLARRCLALVFAFAVPGVVTAAPARFEDGLVLYRHSHLEEAGSAWEEALSRDPRDRRVLAYLAETYRRQGRFDRADQYAHRALGLDSCDTHALNVLADLHNPHFESITDTSFAETQGFLAKAAACDSTDGNLWFDAYVLATRDGDLGAERTAVRWLERSGILTPAVLAYARWTLQDLPRNAILLTNGDMDTYPERALQQEESFRPDVGVINVSLLEDPKFARVMAKRHGLPFVDMTESNPTDSAEAALSPAWRLIRRWLSDVEAKKIARPIAIATSVDITFYPPDPRIRAQDWEHVRYAGPFYYFLPGERGQSEPDTSRLRENLARFPAAALRGAWADERDTSPIHHSATALKSNIVLTGVIYASAFAVSGQETRLRAAFDLLKQLVTQSGVDMEPAVLDSVFERMRAGNGTASAGEPDPHGSDEVNVGDPQLGEYVYVEELPEPLTRVPPSYPADARDNGIQGEVGLQALVGVDGHVKRVLVQRSIPALDEAAMAAVRQWTFKPARAKGKNIAVWVAVPVRFSLH